MIDLTGITTVCDVSIKVTIHAFEIGVEFSAQKEKECGELLQDLNALGIRCYEPLRLHLTVYGGNLDTYQLAERIAIGLESQGLKVRRLVTPPPNLRVGSGLFATREIQSFILA
jgi:hypothetical protein